MKKCTLCDSEEAKFKIKGSNNYYCKDCALENFGDLGYLESVEKEALELKKMIKERYEKN